MSETIRHLAWFFVVASAISYSIFLIAGGFISASATDAARIAQVRDSLSPGAHHLSGMVMVPSTCSELSVRTEDRGNYTYELVFTTWKEPAVRCSAEDTPRAFHALLFAPAAGVHIIATLDGSPLTLALFPAVQGN
jgi:hypothetical protein